MPTCLAATYPQSLSHLRRNRYSNLLQRFSLESQQDSLFDHVHGEHFLGAVTPLAGEHRHRGSSCFEAASASTTRTLKVNSLPLSNVPEVIVVDEGNATAKEKRQRKKKAWKSRFGGSKKNRETTESTTCHFVRTNSSASASAEPVGTASSQLQPGVSSLSNASSSSSINAFK
jgi:hypothetical protein